MRTRVLFMSTSSLSKVSFDVSPVVSYKNWSSPPWNLTWMTTMVFFASFLLAAVLRLAAGRVDGVYASQIPCARCEWVVDGVVQRSWVRVAVFFGCLAAQRQGFDSISSYRYGTFIPRW